MALVGSINFLLGMESSKFSAGANRGIKDLNRLSGAARATQAAISGMSTVLGAIGIGIGINQVVGFFRSAHEEAQQAAESHRKLLAVWEATGGVVGLSTAAIEAQADELERLSAIDDDVIKSAQALLLQFKRVKGDVFTEGTAMALDLSRAMNKDLSASMLLVGKSLNDPIRGIALLRKAGVDFTADQQATIKSMMKMNDIAGAQGMILKGLASTVGGTAKKMRDEWQAVANEWEKFKESIGNMGSGGETGRGFANRFAEGISEFRQELEFISEIINSDLPAWEKLNKFWNDLGDIGEPPGSRPATQKELLLQEQQRAAERDAGLRQAASNVVAEHGVEKARAILAVAPDFPHLEEAIRASDITETNRRQRQEMLGGDNFGNDPVGRALSREMQLAISDFLTPDRMLAGLDPAAMHAIDSAIDRTRQADMADDMPEIRDRQFAGAAMRGSEEAFATIAAFQGSRESDRVAQRAREQLEATKAIEDAVRANFIEVELQPIA